MGTQCWWFTFGAWRGTHPCELHSHSDQGVGGKGMVRDELHLFSGPWEELRERKGCGVIKQRLGEGLLALG